MLTENKKDVVIKQDEQPTSITRDEVEKMINDAVESTKKKIDDFEKKLVTDKASLVTVFGIFASIVTFLSVEIQILKSVCDSFRLLGFTFVLLSSLLLFVLVLHQIANYWINEKKSEENSFVKKESPKYLFCFIVGLFIIGTLMVALGGDDSRCRENYIFQRYERDFNKRQLELEDILDIKMNEINKSLDKKIQNQKNNLSSDNQ